MKKLITFFTLAVALTAGSNTTFAQDAQAMKKWMDYMTPGDMHKMLAAYEGNWNAEVTMYMPGMPPTTSKMTSETKMILGGRYQVSTEKGSFNGMPFEAVNTLGFDNNKKIFTCTWLDNFGTGTITMEGTYDPTTKTINLKGDSMDPMTGKATQMRETMQFIDKNTQKWEMFNIKDGKETKSMEVKVTRA